MRYLDNMTPQEIDTLALKGMTAPRTAGERAHSAQCKGTPRYYDGALGYEAMKCDVCGYEQDLNAEANAKATAEREANKVGRFHIKEGHTVIHKDEHGESQGIADSDAMLSSNRIKVSFTSGPRLGECRWIPLEQITAIAPLPQGNEAQHSREDEAYAIAYDIDRGRGNKLAELLDERDKLKTHADKLAEALRDVVNKTPHVSWNDIQENAKALLAAYESEAQ